jgi:hypothetical protein
MKIDKIKDVIAERRFQKIGSPDLVVVRIGKPEKFPESDDFYCPYEIIGIGKEGIRYAGGVDTAQALLLAFKMIGADLYTSKEVTPGGLVWEGSKKGDLGFPVPGSISDLIPRD